MTTVCPSRAWPIVLYLEGQIPSGKNRIGLRTGLGTMSVSKLKVSNAGKSAHRLVKKRVGSSHVLRKRVMNNLNLIAQIRKGSGGSPKIHRFPQTRFKTWRAESANQFHTQISRWRRLLPIQRPVVLTIHYWPSDGLGRDLDGMLSALGHLFEWTGVLEHDGQIMETHWYRYPMDRQSPGVVMVFEPYSDEARNSVNLIRQLKDNTMDLCSLQHWAVASGSRNTDLESRSCVRSHPYPSNSRVLV